MNFIVGILQLRKHVLVRNLVHIKHILFELAHELHVVERVNLQLGQLVVEAPLADFGGLCNIRVHRELLA